MTNDAQSALGGLSRLATAAFVFCCATGCFLSGTGSRQPAAGPPAVSITSAEQTALVNLIHEAAESTKSLTSVHLIMATTGKVKELGHISRADVDVRTTPLEAQGKVTYDGQVDIPFLLMDDTVSVQLFDDWTDIGSVSDLFPPGLINPSVGVEKILQSVTDIKSDGSERINGIATTKVTGKISEDAAKIVLPSADGPKDIAVWIMPDRSHEVVRSLVEVTPGSTVENTLSNWNSPVTIARQQ